MSKLDRQTDQAIDNQPIKIVWCDFDDVDTEANQSTSRT